MSQALVGVRQQRAQEPEESPLDPVPAHAPTALAASPDGLVGTDLAGTITNWNDACQAIFGHQADAVLGKSARILCAKGKEAEGDALLERVRAGKSVWIPEAELIRQDGSSVWVSVSASPWRDGEGHVVGALAIHRDVTRRRHEEGGLRRLASVVRDSNDAITVQDLDGRLEAWNRGAERMYGYTESEALGMNSSQLVPAAERARAVDLVRQIRTGAPVDSVEIQRVTKDGRTLDVWLTVTKLLDNEGNIVGFATTERDVTERRAIEQERWEARERAQELARLQDVNLFKTQFINMAAHELWTPLMPLRTQVHLLIHSLTSPPAASQKVGLDLIERNLERFGKLVEDLLTVARSQAGRLGIEPQRMELGKVLDEAAEAYHAVARGRGSGFTVPRDVEVLIEADRKRISQVLANLLSNAFKFTPRGGDVRIEVTEEGTMVRISVTDSGMGIATTDLPRLFIPFVQVHDTTQVTAPGSGLGLYICKQFIEMHGGSVGASSPGRGQGSTFWFTLPKAGMPTLASDAKGWPQAPPTKRTPDETPT